MIRSLPKISELIRDLLGLSKTEANILFLLWSQEKNNYSVITHELTGDDTVPEFDSKLVKRGLSIKEFMDVLNLTQSSIQKAMKSLISKGYLARVMHNREYRYKSTSKAFETFQQRLRSYQDNLGVYFAPLLNTNNAKQAFGYIQQQIKNDWVIEGWRQYSARENYLFRWQNTHSGGLQEEELEMLKRDTDGSEITDRIQQVPVGNSLHIRTGKPYTSVLHLQANIQQSLWNIQCSQIRPQNNE